MADITIENGGILFTFTPHTDAAREWIAENVNVEPWQWFGPALVVQQRYAGELAVGMIAAGLEVR